MVNPISVEKCRTFIDCQLSAAKSLGDTTAGAFDRPTITISRQTGSGARAVAAELATYLQIHDTRAPCGWTVFDKNLVQKILEDHHLPSRLAQYMPERKISEIDDAVGEILGLHPSAWTLLHHTTDTILRLAKMGNVILVGRGSTIITAKLKNAFHVRLIGSLPKRADQTAEYYQISLKEALAFVEKEDKERERYLRKNFGRDIEDPLLYHLTINTDWISFGEAARIIGDAVIHRQNAAVAGQPPAPGI
jgi:cytidylate kinase